MKRTLTAIAVLGMGLICGLLRRMIWDVTYDPATQLLTEPELLPLSHGLMIVCLLIALVLLVKLWPKGWRSPAPYGSDKLPVKLARLAAGILAAGSGLVMAKDVLELVSVNLIPLLMGLFQTLGGVAMIALTLDGNRQSGRYHALLLLPTFTSCYWMVAFYHAFGSSPNAEVYLYPILAGLSVMACWIYYTGFALRPGEGRRFACFVLVLLLTVPSAMPAPLTDGYRLSLAAQLIWFFAAFCTLAPQEQVRPIHTWIPDENTEA